MVNKKTNRRQICDLASAINNRITQASGLSFRDQVLLVAGFITGFFGLQTAFIYVVWGFIILTILKVVLLSLSERQLPAPEWEPELPPYQPAENLSEEIFEQPETNEKH